MIKEYESNGHDDDLFNFASKFPNLWQNIGYTFSLAGYNLQIGYVPNGEALVYGDGIELKFTLRGVIASDPFLYGVDPKALKYYHKLIITTPDDIDPDEVLIKMMIAVS